MDDVHEQFVQAVSSSRNLSEEDVRLFADGRIMTGRQALEFKLIDEFGGLERTIEVMGQKIGIVGYPSILEEKEEVPFIDWLVQSVVSKGYSQSILPTLVPRLQYLWNP